MFTKNKQPGREAEEKGRKGPGRPPGRTAKGEASRRALHAAAVAQIAEKGYERATMRDIADRAGVSPGLLYKYFPGKQAVVLALHDDLSGEYAEQARRMKPGAWRDRALFAMRTSLRVLAPQRDALRALTAVLVGDSAQGLFAPATSGSRERVQQAFLDAVTGAKEKLSRKDAERLGRILYVVHLAVILWWLLDRSPKQRATDALLSLLTRLGGVVSLAVRLPGASGVLRAVDQVIVDGLLGEQPTGGEGAGPAGAPA